MNKNIEIVGASIHNLKKIDVRIPKNKLTVITGVSGSGKSSLAFDTLYEEGKRRYLLFSGSQFAAEVSQPFERISGLSPTVAVEQRITRQSNPRSTVGTRTKIGNMMAILFAALGQKGYSQVQAPLAMEMFQKNSPKGMCAKCLGTGQVKQIDEEALFADQYQRLDDVCFGLAKRGTVKAMLKSFCRVHQLTPDRTLASLTQEQQLSLKYGDGGASAFMGYIPLILNIIKGGKGNLIKMLGAADYLQIQTCPRCKGTGLSREAGQIKVAGHSITELEELSLKELQELLAADDEVSSLALGREIISKLSCMVQVGLHHLSLSRPVPTLSGGEIQRLFLASYIIAEMDSIVFIFDEPTIGLHEVEKENLIRIIRHLVDRENTVIAVEHDQNFMKEADYIIDLGPGAGRLGGELIYQGGFDGFLECRESCTSPYLNGRQAFKIKTKYRTGTGRSITICNASVHNLKDISVSLPLDLIVGIAGVSGSGKSSLIYDTLLPGLMLALKRKCVIDDDIPAAAGQAVIEGIEQIDKCVVVDQKPIGRTKTSCPATYTGIYDRIRDLFAAAPAAVEEKLDKGHFSINSKGGCHICKGEGTVRHYVGYGNFIGVECTACRGTGFKEEILTIRLDGQTIYDVFRMTVDEAYDFFKDKDQRIGLILETLQEVGMGYIRLGQKTPTISGGESQRIKLAKELAAGKAGKKKERILYLMDEPTTGLSYHDSVKLMKIMERLVDEGSSLIVVEHDPFILSNCDYIIEMGVGGGKDGGEVIAAGTPEQLRKSKESIIGGFLL